jgi:hypothetical protein
MPVLLTLAIFAWQLGAITILLHRLKVSAREAAQKSLPPPFPFINYPSDTFLMNGLLP